MTGEFDASIHQQNVYGLFGSRPSKQSACHYQVATLATKCLEQ